MRGPDFELGVHPEKEENISGKRSGGMSRGKTRHGVLEGLFVGVGADVNGVHDLMEADAVETGVVVGGSPGNIRLADIEEIRAQSANELFDNDLE